MKKRKTFLKFLWDIKAESIGGHKVVVHVFLITVVFYCFVMAGCKTVNKETVIIEIDTYSYENLEYPTADVQILDAVQKEFVENSFWPWTASPEELMASLDSFPGKDFAYLKSYLNDDEWYGENKKPHAKWQREEIVNNDDTESFPNFLKKGIVIAHTDLRRIPTNKPGFDVYSKAGEGYPFDYFQETVLWANTPILLVHTSDDKQWCYVISPYYKGWVAMHDVAVVNEEFIQKWSTGNYCMPLSDGVVLQNAASHYAIKGKMGMLLPYEESSNQRDSIVVYYANADENQNAKILKAEIKANNVALSNFKFNENNLKQLVSKLVRRPYGWGGYLENRDCSSMIRDLLGTFRIWLPRDSKDQMNVGLNYELSGTADEKLKLIKDKGVPFLTILRKKGHNMLYVGKATDGQPLILHAIWGLKTSYSNEQLAEYLESYPLEGIHQDEDGKLKGRHIIGEAVITPVTIGSGNDGITIPLLDEIYTMTNILEN